MQAYYELYNSKLYPSSPIESYPLKTVLCQARGWTVISYTKFFLYDDKWSFLFLFFLTSVFPMQGFLISRFSQA